MNSIFTRVSVRDFLLKPVEEEKITLLLKAGMQAPSAKNEQSWEFYVVEKKETLNKLSSVSPYSTFVKDAPLCIVPCYRINPPCKDYVFQDMACCTENILLEAEELSLGACYIGIAPIEERVNNVISVLSLPSNLIPFCLIPIGYPKSKREATSRYDENKVHFIKENEDANQVSEIKSSLTFWNEAYKGIGGQKFDKKDLQVVEPMQPIFNKFVEEGKEFLDFGCGAGEMLLYILAKSPSAKCYGIENGANIVNCASEMIKSNDFSSRCEILDGGIKAIEKFKEESIDRIVLSNVLDIVTEDVSDMIMNQLHRVLKKGGLMLFKVNPEFTPEQMEKMGFINFKDNLYSKNGVMRDRYLPSKEWEKYLIDKFKFKIVDKALVPYQAPSFLDRLYLLQKL